MTAALRDTLARLRSLHEKATPGPVFVAADCADDTIAHRDSGLALIDTGRQEDWPIARLCHWPDAEYIAALHNALPAILAELERAQRIEAALLYIKIGTQLGGQWKQLSVHEIASIALAQPDEKERSDEPR